MTKKDFNIYTELKYDLVTAMEHNEQKTEYGTGLVDGYALSLHVWLRRTLTKADLEVLGWNFNFARRDGEGGVLIDSARGRRISTFVPATMKDAIRLAADEEAAFQVGLITGKYKVDGIVRLHKCLKTKGN